MGQWQREGNIGYTTCLNLELGDKDILTEGGREKPFTVRGLIDAIEKAITS